MTDARELLQRVQAQLQAAWPEVREVHRHAGHAPSGSPEANREYPGIHAQGSGTGVLDARELLQRVQAQLQAAWPQVREFLDMPGALEMRAELLGALSQRFFARTIKMILGPQVRSLGARLSLMERPPSAGLMHSPEPQA